VIGRAVRLVLQNVGGARPGHEDRATLGHPGKFTYCLAENEAASPWAPLHVERGFAAGASCVTVCGSEAPHNVNDHGSSTPEAMLMALAGTAATTGSNNVYLGGEPLVILGPEHAQTLAGSGWSKANVKQRLWERVRVRLDRFSAENLARFATIDPARFAGQPPGTEVAWCPAPDDLMVIVAGGPGKHSSLVPTFGATRSVTLAIDESPPAAAGAADRDAHARTTRGRRSRSARVAEADYRGGRTTARPRERSAWSMASRRRSAARRSTEAPPSGRRS